MLVFVPLFVMRAIDHPMDAVFVSICLMAAFSAVGSALDRTRAIAGLALGLGLLLALLIYEQQVLGEGEGPGFGDFYFLASAVTIPWALAVELRSRATRVAFEQRRADRLERKRDELGRKAVAEERAPLARELHDIVAHSISVIAVQSGSLRRRLGRRDPEAADELSGVEQTARQALDEMRRMLGLLRAPADDASLAPQPGMSDATMFVDHARQAGVDVALTFEGTPRPLPAGVHLASRLSARRRTASRPSRPSGASRPTSS